MPTIFVSYRRKDAAADTGRIVEHLRKRFGKRAVFNDVFDIKGGQRFREVIFGQLRDSKVLVAVIGKLWLTAIDDEGQRRLDAPGDYVRFEIATALSQPECVVIPVLVNHQQIPKKDTLPKEIKELVDRNAVHVRPDPDFADDMEHLCELVAEHVPPKKTWPKAVAAVAVVVTLVAAAFFVGPGPKVPDTVVQAFDSSTGERILRPFSLILDDGLENPLSVQHLLVDTDPHDVHIRAVDCPGYKSAFNASRVDVTESTEGFLMKIPLDRATRLDDLIDDKEFVDEIQPDNMSNITGWPTDEEITSECQGNVSAKDVHFIVDNRTNQHVDVLLYWLPPSNAPALKNPFTAAAARWTHINDGAIHPGEKVCFDSFRLEPGYFFVFVSANSIDARKLHSGSLYKDAWAVATITELTEEGVSLSYYESVPRELRRVCSSSNPNSP